MKDENSEKNPLPLISATLNTPYWGYHSPTHFFVIIHFYWLHFLCWKCSCEHLDPETTNKKLCKIQEVRAHQSRDFNKTYDNEKVQFSLQSRNHFSHDFSSVECCQFFSTIVFVDIHGRSFRKNKYNRIKCHGCFFLATIFASVSLTTCRYLIKNIYT